MKGSEFVFHYIHLLYYKCHKANPNRGGSFIDSLDWTKSRKRTANPINTKVIKCFKYDVTVALNHAKIGKHSKTITKIKPLTNKYNWEEINFPSEKDNWKKFEKNNRTKAINILYARKEKIYPAYVSFF